MINKILVIMFRNKETLGEMYGGEKMDQSWIKAVTQLCIIAQNDTYLKRTVMRYIDIMKEQYALDEQGFRNLYARWVRSGEIDQQDWRTGRNSEEEQETILYHKEIEGLCRMLEEGVIDETMFYEILREIPYEVLDEGGCFTGYYPSLPGCIGQAETRQKLDGEMQTVLKKWIRNAYIMWRENNILEE